MVTSDVHVGRGRNGVDVGRERRGSNVHIAQDPGCGDSDSRVVRWGAVWCVERAKASSHSDWRRREGRIGENAVGAVMKVLLLQEMGVIVKDRRVPWKSNELPCSCKKAGPVPLK